MIGETVSHYKILEKLGEGGMGVVFKAEDTKLDRLVALKFLPRQLHAAADAKKRFILEARSASKLDHPNICTIHEIDETADGRTFIVMPCYQGQTLGDMLEDGPLDPGEAIAIVCQVASGLARAHEKGIVHRDIKPGNILLTEDGQVKIVDFGLAKLSGSTRITKTGTTMGTVSYMSPEQALGGEVGAASDVFSLGVVLYELLSGRLPFDAEHEAAILYQLVHEDIPPLSTHRGDIPEALTRVVERALEKEVGRRYADGAELLEALEDAADVLELGRPSRRHRVRRSRRARLTLGPRARIALAVVGIAVVAVVAKTLWQNRVLSPSEAHALAVVDFRDLATPDDRTISAGMTGLVQVGLVESSPIRVISPEYLYDLRRRLFDTEHGPIEETEALEVARQSGATMLLTGQMGSLGGVSYVTWRLVDIASGESLAARRVEGANQVLLADQIIAEVLPLLAAESGAAAPVAQPSVSTLTTSSQEAYKHYVAGILAREEARTKDAFRELRRAVALDSTFALAFFEIGRTYDLDLERDAARAWAERAWRQRSRLGIKDRMRLEAWREWVADRDIDAIATYREMLARWPDDHKVLSDLSDILFYNWYYDEAVTVSGQALELYTDDAVFGNIYGTSLAYVGRTDEALAAAREYVKQHPENPNAWDDLGQRYLTVAEPDSAEAAFRKALELDPEFVWSMQGIGYCDFSRGDLDRAIATFEDILRSAHLSRVDSVSILADISFWPGLAFCYLEAGRFAKAIGFYDAAWQALSGPETARETEGRIQLLMRAGRPGEALRWAKRLSADAASDYERLSAARYRARALVAVDSLDAARRAADDLRALEQSSGRSEPFQLLRVSADIALAAGDGRAALAALTEMAQRGVPLGGSKDIERRESTARALQLAGRNRDAAAVLEEMLRVYGSHAIGRYQLGQVYEAMGRPAKSRQQYERFLDAWAGADPGLPAVADARKRLQALGGGED
ncbi:MAG: protein kinase [Candidatus Krumholzibacteriia bacterium]